MKIKAIIYDLDGTLTYTLTDLHLATNYALRRCGYAERSLEEIRSFVGNGVGMLIAQAVPEGTDEGATAACLKEFTAYYLQHCMDNTTLYDGVREMMQDIKKRGYLTAIVSNKVQSGVDELHARFFTGLVDVAIGERAGVPRKPAPDMVLAAIEALGVRRDECVYIGDSEVDVATARNSGLPCISVLWGFRDREALVEAGANTFAATPNEVLELLSSAQFA